MTMKDNKDTRPYFLSPVRGWTLKQLKAEHLSTWRDINVIGCFGVRDMALLESIEAELARRGYEVIESQTVKYQRVEG